MSDHLFAYTPPGDVLPPYINLRRVYGGDGVAVAVRGSARMNGSYLDAGHVSEMTLPRSEIANLRDSLTAFLEGAQA